MRYGVVSDIHGNLPALQSAIGQLRRMGVDRWLCAGDVVGYGAAPNECLETLAELDAITVLGNHELMLLGRVPEENAGQLARDTIRWTRDVLRDDLREHLARLPLVVTPPGVVMAHATLDSAERRIVDESHAAEQLDRLAEVHPGVRFLLVGHTHRQWAYQDGVGTMAAPTGAPAPLAPPARFLLNPGSVGQSRQPERRPRSRFLLLDTERSEAEFFAADYDVSAARRMLHRHGLPYDCIHRSPALLSRLRRRGRRELRALRGKDVYLDHPSPATGGRS